MKRLVGIVLALVLAAVPVLALARDDGSRTEARLRELEKVWNEAHLHGDVAALDRLWADSLVVTVPEMPPFSKADLMGMWRHVKIAITEYSTSDLRIHAYDRSATVTGRLRRVRDFGGKQATDDWLFTKSYARVGGDWKVVAFHASVLPAR